MASLSTKPRSITRPQMVAMFGVAKRRGIGLDDLRDLAGGSIRELSRADASALIEQIGGGELANAPGKAPRPSRKSKPGVTRMITPAHVEQIERLCSQAFPSPVAAAAWLAKDFKASSIRALGTAKRAGDVITTLRAMLARRTETQHGTGT